MSSQVHNRSVSVYVLVALGLPWLISLPLWTDGGLASPYAPVLLSLIMITPTLAAVIALRTIERDPDPVKGLLVPPTRPIGRFIGWLLLAHVAMLILVIGALFVSAAFGHFDLDMIEFSALRELLQAQLDTSGASLDDLPVPMWVFAVATLPGLFLGSMISALIAAGEELGWRGFLFPRLQAYGRVAALILQGVIWGLWHAPILLLGYHYGDIPGWQSLALMMGFCTVTGALLSWVTERTRSIWPAAVAHGTLNTATGAAVVALGRADATLDPVQGTILGWSGWILPGLLALALWAFWAPPQRREATLEPAEAGAAS